jgi:hypothetical protein
LNYVVRNLIRVALLICWGRQSKDIASIDREVDAIQGVGSTRINLESQQKSEMFEPGRHDWPYRHSKCLCAHLHRDLPSIHSRHGQVFRRILIRNIYVFIAARTLQAAGCSAAVTAATAMIKDVYSGRNRGKAS